MFFFQKRIPKISLTGLKKYFLFITSAYARITVTGKMIYFPKTPFFLAISQAVSMCGEFLFANFKCQLDSASKNI